jgi:hypothetical protein
MDTTADQLDDPRFLSPDVGIGVAAGGQKQLNLVLNLVLQYWYM